MADLRDLLDLFDRLVASSAGAVEPSTTEAAAEQGRAARRRVGYLGDTILVALAGGTGSGKSSLLNAMAGEVVSEPGARRPTTSRAVAWVPANTEPGLVRLLDDLGIDDRTGHAGVGWLAVLDLPDTDSVVIDHRLAVEALLPLVDVVVWVVDPEKYQDARLHRDFLAPLAGWSGRFVFALNQIDRVPDDARAAMVEDLRHSLRVDGVDDPVIVCTAGDPPMGLPIGVDDLVEAVDELGSAADIVAARVVDGLVAAADRIAGELGGTGGSGFTEGWAEARDSMAVEIADALTAELDRAGALTARRDASIVTSLVGGRTVAATIETTVPPVSGGVTDPLHDLVERVGAQVDAATRASLVAVADDAEATVDAIVLEAGAAIEVPLPAAPAWWAGVRLLSYGLVAVMVIGLVLGFDAVRSGGTLVEPAVVLIGGVAGTAIVRRVVLGSARTRVSGALGERRESTSTMIVSELERRLGRPIRDVLRVRSAPATAHTEFMLAVRRHEEERH